MKNKLEKKNILVIGDLMLDSYNFGTVKRVSPEAPIPVLLKQSTRDIIGGAGNVALNLQAAGQCAHVCSIIGNDYTGNTIIKILEEKEICTTGLFRSEKRKTTLKTRFVSGIQQLLRVDEEEVLPLSNEEEELILEYLTSTNLKWDAIIFSDYSKGIVTESICQHIIAYAKQNDIKVFFDVKENNFSKYKGAFLVKPNKKELEMLFGGEIKNNEELYNAMRIVKKRLDCNKLMVTLSSEGMVLLNENGEFTKSSARVENVYDVVGAGDTALSYIVTAFVNEYSDSDALELANSASSIKVTKFGTSPVYIEEVLESNKERANKIVPASFFENHVWRSDNKIVFTNGCFDILHVGHLKYLEKAKTFGDILIVGVNSDLSVSRLKGPSRPINSEKDRMELLAGLDCVDYVILFDEDTPLNLIKLVKPNILVKGADYKSKPIVGSEFVLSHGGEVVLIDYIDGKSTTNIINRVKENE